MNITKFQIGKNGVTDGVLESLALAFKNHKQVRISILKSFGRDKNEIANKISEMVSKLKKETGYDYNFKIIGFTIILIKSQKSG